jgi:hypothetical protein
MPAWMGVERRKRVVRVVRVVCMVAVSNSGF